ncbi:iron sulfur protein [Bacillus sp. ZZV12-4809]|nr:iron sulfur protein [Bacillus sp. ZZV12-4809]
MRMFAVYYLDGKNVLLNQLRKSVPHEGEEVRIKGRKGKVTSVMAVEESKIHVQVELESVNKAKLAAADDKKKKKKR